MNNIRTFDDSPNDVEALMRAAQGYVQVSDELRPRVLDAARVQHQERRTRRRIERLGLIALVFAMIVASLRSSWEVKLLGGPAFLSAAGISAPFFEPVSGPGDAAWNLVELFTDMRRRQAEVLRQEAPPEPQVRRPEKRIEAGLWPRP